MESEETMGLAAQEDRKKLTRCEAELISDFKRYETDVMKRIVDAFTVLGVALMLCVTATVIWFHMAS